MRKVIERLWAMFADWLVGQDDVANCCIHGVPQDINKFRGVTCETMNAHARDA